MPRKTESVDLLLLKGNLSGLTEAEIKERREKEKLVRGSIGLVEAPNWLSKKQKEEFDELAQALTELDIFGSLDVDTLAMYVETRTQFVEVIKAMRRVKPAGTSECPDTGKEIYEANKTYRSLQQTKDSIHRQMRGLASEMGLTLDSRMRLVVPKATDKKEKVSKFSAYGGGR